MGMMGRWARGEVGGKTRLQSYFNITKPVRLTVTVTVITPESCRICEGQIRLGPSELWSSLLSQLSCWELKSSVPKISCRIKKCTDVKIPSYTGKNCVKHFIFENGVIPSLGVFVPPISVLFMWVSYNVHLLYTYCTHSTLDDVQRVGGGKNLYKKCIELYKPLW